MKKVLLMFLVLICLFGCSKTVTCAECGQTKSGKTYKITLLGQEQTEDICNDCIDAVKVAVQLFGGEVK